MDFLHTWLFVLAEIQIDGGAMSMDCHFAEERMDCQNDSVQEEMVKKGDFWKQFSNQLMT